MLPAAVEDAIGPRGIGTGIIPPVPTVGGAGVSVVISFFQRQTDPQGFLLRGDFRRATYHARTAARRPTRGFDACTAAGQTMPSGTHRAHFFQRLLYFRQIGMGALGRVHLFSRFFSFL